MAHTETCPMDTLLACKFCLWTDVARSGDLVVTTTDTEGKCISHEVKHL